MVCAASLVLALSACAPRTYIACMNEASAKPTDAGVRMAAWQCAKRFPEEYAQQNAASSSAPTAFDEFVPLRPAAEEPRIDYAAAWQTVREWWARRSAFEIALGVWLLLVIANAVIEVRRRK